MVRRLVDLPEETWKRLKTQAAQEGKTLKELMEEIVDRKPVVTPEEHRIIPGKQDYVPVFRPVPKTSAKK